MFMLFTQCSLQLVKARAAGENYEYGYTIKTVRVRLVSGLIKIEVDFKWKLLKN